MRREILTEEEVKIILNEFKAPSFMLANIKMGGSFIQTNYGLEIKKENNEYIAIIEN